MVRTVLIVDDCEAMRRLIARHLRIPGCGPIRVMQAEDGEQALEVAINCPVDLILCDLEMPRMGGLELLRALRRSEATAAVPFVVVAGLTAGDGPFVEALLEGAQGCLRKPFSGAQLQDLVRPLLAPLT